MSAIKNLNLDQNPVLVPSFSRHLVSLSSRFQDAFQARTQTCELLASHNNLVNKCGDLRKAEDIWKKHCWFGAPWKKKRIKENFILEKHQAKGVVWDKLEQR